MCTGSFHFTGLPLTSASPNLSPGFWTLQLISRSTWTSNKLLSLIKMKLLTPVFSTPGEAAPPAPLRLRNFRCHELLLLSPHTTQVADQVGFSKSAQNLVTCHHFHCSTSIPASTSSHQLPHSLFSTQWLDASLPRTFQQVHLSVKAKVVSTSAGALDLDASPTCYHT